MIGQMMCLYSLHSRRPSACINTSITANANSFSIKIGRSLRGLIASLLLFFSCGCTQTFYVETCEPELTCINVIDQNGTSETISNVDRLKKYVNVDFLKPQPYQKVLRIFKRDECGNLPSVITSYYSNGMPNQYLEVLNGRAKGAYLEWYEDGTQKINAYIVGGAADLTSAAEETWLFDGLNQAWDEEGRIQAELEYVKGSLDGLSLYYHTNGNVWKRISLQRGQIEGVSEIFLENGDLFQAVTYSHGVKNGPSKRYWCGQSLAADECYSNGRLDEGRYYDIKGQIVGEIKKGAGFRAVFGKESLTELQEYVNGVPEGLVKVFSRTGDVVQTYNIRDGVKHGQEFWFFEPKSSTDQESPKLMISWYEGKVQGLTKTWYPNGNQECVKEMSNNARNGLSTAWYRDGSLMMIEEYEKDKLVKGEYYKKGDFIPMSIVRDGTGMVTLYDADGSFLRKIEYTRGNPEGST